MLVALSAVILAVHAGVNGNKSVAAERCRIGEHSALVALCGHKETVSKVIAEVCINLPELLGRSFFCRSFFSALKRAGVAVSDIMVARSNKNLNARFRFKSFKPCRKSLVTLKLAVLCQVAGNKNIVFSALNRTPENTVKRIVKQRIRVVIFLVFVLHKLLPLVSLIAFKHLRIIMDIRKHAEMNCACVGADRHGYARNKQSCCKHGAYQLQ